MALTHEIERLLRQRYGDQLLALGLYGSTARGEDGPYSDIEIHCVIRGKGIETSFEWSAGAWKAEVDVYSQEVILAQAAALDGDWPITHGAFLHVQALHDPQGLFPRLSAAAFDHSPEEFRDAAAEVIVGEIYELIGKIRNTAQGETGSLVYFFVMLARHAACLLGLDQRQVYRSTARLFADSLALPDRPDGYDDLCHCVMTGNGLNDAAHLRALSDLFWEGLIAWAAARQLPIEQDTAALLLSSRS